ncbi:3'-5' exonuclease [Toxorhynchites rutilus septentrionalis]|uniref:3'-5' exonuclease n=1 Tax=Toxorhynchites rutilus septentrionalis TaxID=329112 RepID=UPI002479C747|nr:3'-5' exonuclease [Toxorhynchites rutilus septentrionalis]
MSKRKQPLWLCDSPIPAAKRTVSNNENKPTERDDVKPKKLSESLPGEENTPRRQLRSNYKIPDEMPKREPLIRLNIDDVPFIEYKGAIKYFTEMHDMAYHCDQLIQWVEQQPEKGQPKVPIGFDLEWPFSFKTGAGKTALMQLCATTDVCYLFQISCLKKLPAAMLRLLNHPRVQLHGVNVKNDFRKLARDFPEAKVENMIESCMELGQWYNRIHGSSGIWSLERLVLQVCQLRIDKNKKVRMSKWNFLPLSDDQKMYAAVDVYIGQQIYHKLREKEAKLEQERLDLALELPTT